MSRAFLHHQLSAGVAQLIVRHFRAYPGMTTRPAQRNRADWIRRWLGLAIGVGLCLLVLSIHTNHTEKPLWMAILQFTLAFGVLLLGASEFSRPDKRKDDQ